MQVPLRKKRRVIAGFTLVELAIVVIIIALITAMGLIATVEAVEGARRSSTETRMNEIEKALMNFRLQNNRLPCPSDPTLTSGNANYGRESASSNCSTALTFTNATTNYPMVVGSVPAKSLNLPEEFMLDGWGRQFRYAVDPVVAKTNAFDIVRAEAQDCSINIVDATNTSRSSGAVYALVSHGKNGHGGYVNGAPISAGVSTSDELANCHCTSTGANDAGIATPKFVQKEMINSTNTAVVFDDIVRFKERWQMANDDDTRRSANNREYQLALVHAASTGKYFFYKRGCHGWTASLPSSVTIAGTCKWSAFTNDNNTLFVNCSNTAPTLNICAAYPVSAPVTTFTGTACASATCTPNCPTSGGYPMAISNNDYLALVENASPWVQIYKVSNTSSTTPLFTPLSTTQSVITLPTAYATPAYGAPTTVFPYNTTTNHTWSTVTRPTILAISKNAEYLFISDGNAFGSALMYGRSDDRTYKRLLSAAGYQPTFSVSACGLIGANCSVLKSAAFSPDGKYFAVGVSGNAAANASVRVWRITPGTPFVTGTAPFTLVYSSAAGIFQGLTGPNVGFSPDSKYLVAAGGSGASGAATNITAAGTRILAIYKIDNNDTFTDITANNIGSYPTFGAFFPTTFMPILWTPESNEFLIPLTIGASGRDMAIFQMRSPTVFELYRYPTYNPSTFYGTSPGNNILGVSIIH